MNPKNLIKDLLGELPYTAEMYWLLRHRDKKIRSRFDLELLSSRLPEMVAQVSPHAALAQPGKKVFFFASLHFWIRHAAATSLALRGLGYDVTLGYLSYSDYAKPISRFDLRRHDLYARDVLQKAHPLLKTVSFLDMKRAARFPAELVNSVEQVTVLDTQYTLQREDVTGIEPVCLLRRERNLDAAQKAFAYFQEHRPDVVIIPNGMIQEFGAVYEAARFLDIPTATYEFGEQSQRIWLAQNRKVMYYEDIPELWASRQSRKLNPEQRAWLVDYLAARQGFKTGDKFAHLWQRTGRAGGEKVRLALGLDDRPVVVLPTNVLGDSATLGRMVFSRSMGEWIERVLLVMANNPRVQLVVRIHPAEANSVGLSVADIIRRALPVLPAHIHLVGPAENLNTYDLMDIADLALVYTTNAGLEMATRGIPVVVSGRAVYRKRGFTIDADSWDEYFQKLELALADLPAHRLTPEQIERAWNFAYSYYREYPRPFPWHIEKLGRALDTRPLSYILSPQGRAEYELTFRQLAGEPIDWAACIN